MCGQYRIISVLSEPPVSFCGGSLRQSKGPRPLLCSPSPAVRTGDGDRKANLDLWPSAEEEEQREEGSVFKTTLIHWRVLFSSLPSSSWKKEKKKKRKQKIKHKAKKSVMVVMSSWREALLRWRPVFFFLLSHRPRWVWWSRPSWSAPIQSDCQEEEGEEPIRRQYEDRLTLDVHS